MKEFADKTFKFDENGEKFSKQTMMWKKDKLLVMSNFSFSLSVFKRLVLQIQGLVWESVKKNLG